MTPYQLENLKEITEQFRRNIGEREIENQLPIVFHKAFAEKLIAKEPTISYKDAIDIATRMKIEADASIETHEELEVVNELVDMYVDIVIRIASQYFDNGKISVQVLKNLAPTLTLTS